LPAAISGFRAGEISPLLEQATEPERFSGIARGGLAWKRRLCARFVIRLVEHRRRPALIWLSVGRVGARDGVQACDFALAVRDLSPGPKGASYPPAEAAESSNSSFFPPAEEAEDCNSYQD
jgi:hypothetical protein